MTDRVRDAGVGSPGPKVLERTALLEHALESEAAHRLAAERAQVAARTRGLRPGIVVVPRSRREAKHRVSGSPSDSRRPSRNQRSIEVATTPHTTQNSGYATGEAFSGIGMFMP